MPPPEVAPGAASCDGGYAFYFQQSYMSAKGVSAGDTINGHSGAAIRIIPTARALG